MTKTQRKPRIGRKRWGDVVRYLTETMKTSGNERMRMQAAMRLADILTLREQREQLELRRELRMQSKADNEPEPEPKQESVDEFLERVSKERSNTNEGDV